MTILTRISLASDYRAQLAAIFPRITSAQLLRFDALVATGRLVTDDGHEHPDMVAWVADVVGVRA